MLVPQSEKNTGGFALPRGASTATIGHDKSIRGHSGMQPPISNVRTGFTLVELLVVIAIIGVLVALLLPAVQAAREAARRTSCTNNLKQIGLGLQLRYSAHQQFPPGMSTDGGGTASRGPTVPMSASWVAFVLPYVEQLGLENAIDWSLYHFNWPPGPGNNAGHNVLHLSIPLFQCPSDIQPEPARWGDVEHQTYARGNYVGNNGVGPMREWHWGPGHRSPWKRAGGQAAAGVFFINSWLSMAEIPDGTSQTAMVSEIRTTNARTDDNKYMDGRGIMHYPEGPMYQHNYTPNSLVPDQIRTSWCVTVPESPCIGAFPAWNTRKYIVTARSNHPGGVNLLVADGSVRIVSDSISLNIWQALSTPEAVAGEGLVGEF